MIWDAKKWGITVINVKLWVSILVNSLWPSDVIWRQGSNSTLAQVMACCLTAPSHYLNQCWLINSKVQWHSSEDNFTKDASGTITEISFKIPYLKFRSNLPGANELSRYFDCACLGSISLGGQVRTIEASERRRNKSNVFSHGLRPFWHDLSKYIQKWAQLWLRTHLLRFGCSKVTKKYRFNRDDTMSFASHRYCITSRWYSITQILKRYR